MKENKEKNEYDLKAEEFLKKTNSSLKIEYLKNDKHFIDDQEKRDIYQVVLKRGDRSYKFKFGQSLHNSGFILFNRDGSRTGHKGFILPDTLRKLVESAKTTIEKRKAITKLRVYFNDKHFNLGSLNYGFLSPSAYDILSCLTKYDPESFKDFCLSYGYDEDSRKAEKVYKLVVDEFRNIERLYNSSEIDLLSDIA